MNTRRLAGSTPEGVNTRDRVRPGEGRRALLSVEGTQALSFGIARAIKFMNCDCKHALARHEGYGTGTAEARPCFQCKCKDFTLDGVKSADIPEPMSDLERARTIAAIFRMEKSKHTLVGTKAIETLDKRVTELEGDLKIEKKRADTLVKAVKLYEASDTLVEKDLKHEPRVKELEQSIDKVSVIFRESKLAQIWLNEDSHGAPNASLRTALRNMFFVAGGKNERDQ